MCTYLSCSLMLCVIEAGVSAAASAYVVPAVLSKAPAITFASHSFLATVFCMGSPLAMVCFYWQLLSAEDFETE
jgi:hypothetical protein